MQQRSAVIARWHVHPHSIRVVRLALSCSLALAAAVTDAFVYQKEIDLSPSSRRPFQMSDPANSAPGRQLRKLPVRFASSGSLPCFLVANLRVGCAGREPCPGQEGQDGREEDRHLGHRHVLTFAFASAIDCSYGRRRCDQFRCCCWLSSSRLRSGGFGSPVEHRRVHSPNCRVQRTCCCLVQAYCRFR